MTEDFLSDKRPDLVTEACAWIAQLETGDLTSEDLAAFREWMARSPAHQQEIRRLAYLSRDVNILTEMAEPLKVAAARQRALMKKDILTSKWGHLRYMTASICVALLLVLGFFFIAGRDSPSPDPVLITTAVGSHRDVKLSDGTVLKLNTDSEVKIEYDADRRKVNLLKGEAFFQVTHNPDRPFIVYAGGKSVRAVGTAFVVRFLPKKFEVTVTEGQVELLNAAELTQDNRLDLPEMGSLEGAGAAPLISSLQLKAGESISYMDSVQTEAIEIISQREIRRKLSWQEGLLDFSQTPLVDVIDDLSRYTSLKIEISDPELRDLKFGGIFRVDELQALFDALETTFDIKVEYLENDIVRLSHH